MGIAMIADPAVTNNVPQNSGRMPKCCGFKSGDHFVPVRNSHTETSRKNCSDSIKSTSTMPTVVMIEIVGTPQQKHVQNHLDRRAESRTAR